MSKLITSIPRAAFREMYPTEDLCLEKLFLSLHGSTPTCKRCGKQRTFYRVKGRKCYECGTCGHQIYPTAGTIFEGCRMPLPKLFEILYDFLTSKKGVSAMQIKIWHGITYKAAWRICHEIRKGMAEPLTTQLCKQVEMDESFIGGKKKQVPGTDKKGIGDKAIVFGMVERRDGRTVIRHVEKKDAKTLQPIIDSSIRQGTIIHHDNNSTYGKLAQRGFKPKLVPKKAKGKFQKVNNNRVEGTWTRLKRVLGGAYIRPSEKHLQKYLDEFCLRSRGGGKWLLKNLELASLLVISYWKVDDIVRIRGWR